MSLTTLTTLVLALVAGVCAWGFGGVAGAGVLAGFLAGAALGHALATWQKNVARTRPDFLMPAFVAGFGIKLVLLVGLTAFFRFVPFAAERVDWRGFLLSFAVVVFVLLLVSTPEAARELKARSLSDRKAL